ncbi:MAG: DinB family protein [bacterium]|nr:DinB family protein [bacterium]
MDGKTAVEIITKERKFLNNILKDLKPEHGDFKPADEMLTASQQIKHIALTGKWFYSKALGTGFEFASFDAYLEEMQKPLTLQEALDLLNETYEESVRAFGNMTEKEFDEIVKDDPMLGTFKKSDMIFYNNEHTAHHRGALSVYLRLLGITPTMIYAE